MSSLSVSEVELRFATEWPVVRPWLIKTKEDNRWSTRRLCQWLNVPFMTHVYSILAGTYIPPKLQRGAVSTAFVVQAFTRYEQYKKNQPQEDVPAQPAPGEGLPVQTTADTELDLDFGALALSKSESEALDDWVDDHDTTLQAAVEAISPPNRPGADVMISGVFNPETHKLEAVTIAVSSHINVPVERAQEVFDSRKVGDTPDPAVVVSQMQVDGENLGLHLSERRGLFVTSGHVIHV